MSTEVASYSLDIWSVLHFVFGILSVYLCRRFLRMFVKDGSSTEETGQIVLLAVIIHQIHELFTQTSPGQTIWTTVGFETEYKGNTNSNMDTIVYTLGVAAGLMYSKSTSKSSKVVVG